jgi:hypothetical protein
MGIQDRDYMRERARLREAESKKSEPKINFIQKFIDELEKRKDKRTKNAYETYLKEYAFIIIPYTLVGLTAFFIFFNLLPSSHSIGKIIPATNKLNNPKNIETNHPIQHQKPIKQTQQQIDQRNKSRICKILKNGEEECRFL